MGRGDKKYHKDLHEQAYEKLTKMLAFGESKRDAMAAETAADKIFSYNTYKTYWKHTKYFIKWVQKAHPEVTTLKKAKKLVPEFLQMRVDQELSAWTIHTEEAALNKLYGIKPDDPERFVAPKRIRSEIKRSRVSAERDKHFSVTNNDELIKFCKGTGLRRSELAALKGKDLIPKEKIEDTLKKMEKVEDRLTEVDKKFLQVLKDTMLFPDCMYFVFVRNGKGGRMRISPIVGKNADQIIERMKNTAPDGKVWQYINSNADIHGYRAEYATEVYKAAARDIKDIPYDKINRGTGKAYQSDVYTCRKDESGKKLDKKAMYVCSKALGHNRISVVADNYIRGL